MRRYSDRRHERRSIRSDIRDRELSQIILVAGLSALAVAGSSSVQARVDSGTDAENLANGAEVCGFQQERALMSIKFSVQHEGACERISFALIAMAEADAHFQPLQRKSLASSLKTNAHSSACGERRAKEVVRIGTRRNAADAIRAADSKLRAADTAYQCIMIGGVACDNNFADLGHD